jgi:cell wall-associated NlpC family hydrolase
MSVMNRSLKNTPSYGIVNISVADIRREPSFQSEMVNQTILGTVVPILDEAKNFCLIENWDGYQGWISRHSILMVTKKAALQWLNADKLIVTENYGLVYRQPEEEGDPITDLVAGTILIRRNIGSGYTEIQLPDQEIGYVSNAITADLTQHQKIQISTEKIVSQARKFMGIPYLWGGTSTKGFDCSGFVQTVFRLLNFELPRDSQQMAMVGTNIPIKKGFESFNSTDLLFFGEKDEKVTHVGIYIGEQFYIHCRGKVGISSLDSGNRLYERDLLLKVQRIIS